MRRTQRCATRVRVRLLLPLLGVVLLVASACNAVVSFNPEGQPCAKDAGTDADQCLAGYVCQEGRCRKGALSPDAGSDDAGAADAGRADAGASDAGGP
jgi:hypothetical protein